MPQAEQIVITAAYRALASRYHPDRWKGDKDEATRMMSKINVAYGVLGDAEKRKAYDASRGSTRSSFNAQTDDAEEAFEEAVHDYDSRWDIACVVYPDLKNLRARLSKTSRALSFSFVVKILESKQFEDREKLAASMESSFLERYFGSNKAIVSYARNLVLEGDRAAVRYLNELVDVLGDGADAEKIIRAVDEYKARIAEKFRNEKYMKEAAARRESQEAMKKKEAAEAAARRESQEAIRKKRAEEIEKAKEYAFNRLRADIAKSPHDWGLTFKFAEMCGYKIDVKRHLLKKSSYKLIFSIDQATKRNTGIQKTLVEVDSPEALSQWIADNLA